VTNLQLKVYAYPRSKGN